MSDRIFNIKLLFNVCVVLTVFLTLTNCRHPGEKKDLSLGGKGDVVFRKIEHAEGLIPANMDSAGYLLKEVKKSISGYDNSTQAFFNNTFGVYLWYKSEFDSAIHWFRKTLELNEDDKLMGFQAQAANNAGTLFSLTGYPDSAAKFLEMALGIDEKRKNARGINKSLYDLGLHYKRKSQYHLALEYLNRLDENLKTDADSNLKIHALSMLGNVYYAIDSIDKALEYFEEGFRLAKEFSDTSLIISSINCLLAVYCDKPGYLDKVLSLTKQSLPIAGVSDYYTSRLILHNNVGNAYLVNGMIDSALVWYEKASRYVEFADNPYQVSGFFNHYAGAWFAGGFYQMARKYYGQALELTKRIQSAENQRDAYLGLARTDSIEGNYMMALAHYQKGIKLKDSVMNLKTRSRIAEMQIIHQTKEKELLINKLQEKDRFNRLLRVSVISFALFVIFVLILILLYSQKRRLVAEQRVIMKQNEQEKIMALLESNKQELTGKALSLAQAEKMISHIKSDINKMIPDSDDKTREQLKTVMKMLPTQHNSEKLWKEFSQRFDDLHDGFIGKLLGLYPNLSPAEARLCAMIKMQLSSKEIAELTGRSVRTVEFTRLKIRHKFNLDSGVNLTQFLLKI